MSASLHAELRSLAIEAQYMRIPVYVASGLENIAVVREFNQRLTQLGYKITYDWTDHGSVQGTVSVENPDVTRIRDVAAHEMRGVAAAYLVVCILPGGRGTHTELGAAIAQSRLNGTRIVMVGDAEAQYGSAERPTCAFYHHPQVMWARSTDEVLEALTPAWRSPELLAELAAAGITPTALK